MTALPGEADGSLDEVRKVLFREDDAEMAHLRREVHSLRTRLQYLESLLIEPGDRAEAVGTVLSDTFDRVDNPEKLSLAMKPAAVRAIHHSARDESDELAVALYPVLGPAVRKMIANLLSFGPPDGGTFVVEQVLLIERKSGLLLAATAVDGKTEESDIISGMLDAIRSFVQDAFDAPEHDGLQDLRVGNISVLVEWGPRAVLASVVKGVPDEAYRTRAAELLEEIHRDFDADFSTSTGVTESLDDAVPLLQNLRGANAASRTQSKAALAVLAIAIVVIVIALVLISR